jgi:hypothetical protein
MARLRGRGLQLTIDGRQSQIELRLSATGAGIGLVGAMVISRLMSSFLYGVKPTDPLCYVASILVAVGVALRG